MIAKNVEDLHSANSNLTKQTALDEKGQLVNGRTEKPNKHDMLTGSRPDGTAFPGAPFFDMTCGNWTKAELTVRQWSVITIARARRVWVGNLLELVASHSWLHPGGIDQHGRRWPVYCFAVK